jgi:hypothetical protein
MRTRNKVILAALTFFGLIIALTIHFVWPRSEIQVLDIKWSPDGKWTAIVQMEVYSAPAFVNDAVYAVRLKGPAQKDRLGDLVMNLPVNYPDPEPSINWRDSNLVVTLANHEKYQYLANPVNGIPITVQWK